MLYSACNIGRIHVHVVLRCGLITDDMNVVLPVFRLDLPPDSAPRGRRPFGVRPFS